MIEHTTKIHSLRNSYLSARGKTKFNAAAKTEGIQVLRFWAENFLHRHFEAGAYQRYGYAARSPRWNRLKMRDHIMWRGRMMMMEKPPKPLVFSGDLRTFVLARRQSMNIISSAGNFVKFGRGKSWGCRVSAKIKYPHPINGKAKFKGEIKRINPDEWRRMSWMWFRGIQDRMRPVQKTEIAFKG